MTLMLASVASAQLSLQQIQKAKAMVAQNPSLLNTPQAKELMQQQGIGSTSVAQTKKRAPEVKNIIETAETKPSDENEQLKSKLTKKIEAAGEYNRLNPLEYMDNDQELYRIKSQSARMRHKKLERFSKTFFKNKNRILPTNITAPRDYIINRGDQITLWIYGATNKRYELEVNNQGNIDIPMLGPVHVAGEKFGEVKDLLTSYLSSSFKNSEVVVDLGSFSTAQVTVTGYVNAPGIYNTTSVASVKDILIEAGGVSDIGSVRHIYVKRDGRTVAKVDYYHLLTLGLEHGDVVLHPGDVIHVPKAYGLVKIAGEVSHEAIYEIERDETLAHLLKYAGGIKYDANAKQIHVIRYDRNSQIIQKDLSLNQAKSFRLKDGDEVYVGKLTPVTAKYIKISGNVLYPGNRQLSGESMSLSKLLKREIKNGKLDTFFLENTDLNYAMIKRIDKDLQPKVFNVNLADILNGKEDFKLRNRDELIVFNKLDTAINPFVTIEQAKTEQEQLTDVNLTEEKRSTILMKSGKYKFVEGMTLKDLINLAGVKSAFDTEKIKIVSYDNKHKKANVKIVNFDKNPDYKLTPFDTVYLFDFFQTNPLPMASIIGEVVKPGTYEVGEGMSLARFIESAGGITERAYPKKCEVIRYHVEKGERKKKIFSIDMNKTKTFIVQAYDEINIKRIPYWSERQMITIKGEVKFPGTYVIHSGEKLSSVIKRAGGFTDQAFLYGAIFNRVEIAKMQKESLKRTLSKLKEQVILTGLMSATSKTMNPLDIGESIKAVESLIKEAELLSPKGRITINLKKDLESFRNSPSDLTLKDKDELYIPSFNDTVVVSGEVMNPSAMTYLGESISDYISKSGGLTEVADTDHIYVIHANGEAEKASLGSFLFSSHSVKVKKGDAIIVPKKLMFERGIDVISNIADIFYKLSLTVAAMHTVGTF